jgi:hypothetical protein
MYLIHGFMMRSVGAWMVYRLVPQGDGLVGRWNRGHERDAPPSLTSPVILQAILDASVLGLWLALVMYLSTLWRDTLDIRCVKASRWGEDVLLGKRKVVESIPFDLRRVIGNINSRSAALRSDAGNKI